MIDHTLPRFSTHHGMLAAAIEYVSVPVRNEKRVPLEPVTSVASPVEKYGVFSSEAMGNAASITPECTEPTMNSALPRWIRLRSLRAPGAGLDSVSSVVSSTLRPAMPPPLLMMSTAALPALSCQSSHDEMTPVRSQWCPITIGPDACANRFLVIVKLAAPARAPPLSAVS